VNLGSQFNKAWDRAFTPKSNDDIAGKAAFVNECSRDRARSAPEGISHHRVPTLGGDNYAHPNKFRWAAVNDEVSSDALGSATNYLTKIAGLNDAVVARQHRG
jgi:hypothetical protein